jgi:hypothetical protein
MASQREKWVARTGGTKAQWDKLTKGMSDREKEVFASGKSSSSSSSSSSSKKKEKAFDYASMGISKSQWQALDPQTQNAVAGIGSVLKKQMEQNQTIPTVLDKKTLNTLYQQAKEDPVISKYYGEELRTSEQDFIQNLELVQDEGTFAQEELQRQQDTEAKNLKELQASAGNAYSGFRNQAEEKLGQTQSGVVESTRRSIQQNLQTLSSNFEKRFGTDALMKLGVPSLASAGGGTIAPITAEQYGGVAGTQAADKLGAVENKYQSLQQGTLQQQGAFETKPKLPS